MTVSQVRCHWLDAAVGTQRMKETFVQLRAGAEPGSALLPLPPGLAERRTTHQRFARVRPAVRVRLLQVVVLQVSPQTLLKLLDRGEIATPQELPRQHAEPHLHLTPPR